MERLVAVMVSMGQMTSVPASRKSQVKIVRFQVRRRQLGAFRTSRTSKNLLLQNETM